MTILSVLTMFRILNVLSLGDQLSAVSLMHAIQQCQQCQIRNQNQSSRRLLSFLTAYSICLHIRHYIRIQINIVSYATHPKINLCNNGSFATDLPYNSDQDNLNLRDEQFRWRPQFNLILKFQLYTYLRLYLQRINPMNIENLFQQHLSLQRLISLDKDFCTAKHKNGSQISVSSNIELIDFVTEHTENMCEPNEIDEQELSHDSSWGFPRPHEKIEQEIFSEIFSLKQPENSTAISQEEEIMKNFHENDETLSACIPKASRRLNMGRKQNLKLKRKEKGSNMKEKLEIEDEDQPKNKPKAKQIKKKGRKLSSSRLTLISKEIKRQKNETKNTVKNYGKELIKFVHDNRTLVEKIIASFSQSVTFEQLDEKLQLKKKNNNMSKMEDLRGLWSDQKFGKVMRIVSQNFFRKHSYYWIFNSRIQDFKSTLKYKARLQQFLADPERKQNLKWS